MKKIVFILLLVLIPSFSSAKPPVKSKFYDFDEQVIDGEIKKPTALFTNARQKVKFERLLRFKKSFIPNLLETAKDKVFK